MSRYLNTRTSIPWKALGQRKIWSDPILIETKLPGAFVQRKDAKEDPLLWQPKLWSPLFYLLLDTKTTGLATVIWKIIAAVLTTTPGHSLNRRCYLYPRLPRNIGVPTIFCTSRFSVTSLFFSLIRRGFKIQQILRKLRNWLRAATICRILRFFVTFCFSYTYLTALPNSTNSEKIARTRGRNDLPHFTIFRHFFVILNRPEIASDFYLSLEKCEKSFPTLLFFFIHLHHFAERPM